MGIEAWVRRDRVVPPADASAAAHEGSTSELSAHREAGAGRPDVATSVALADSPARTSVDRQWDPEPEAPDTAARDLRALFGAPPPADTGKAAWTGPAMDSAPATPSARSPEAPTLTDGVIPRFRIRVLTLGNGLLLIDESALPDEPREPLQRAGDLLRAGCLLRGFVTEEPVESQVFHWPQIDVATQVDQSMPRAIEALCAFARRRAEAADGFLIVMAEPPATGPGASAIGSDGREPLEALDTLPLPRVRVPGAFLTAADAGTDRSAWASLLRLRLGSADG